MVERILVDTDVLIDYFRGRYKLPKASLYISEVTIYEFIRGCRNIIRCKDMLEKSFPIIWFDNEILLEASRIWREMREEGIIIDDRDLLIGVTAVVKNLKLLTNNKKHFSKLIRYGLSLV